MSSDDENALPPLAPSHSASSKLHASLSFRKRSRGYDSSNSSDAPFFSSDDLAEASLDNYQSPRRKRVHRRAWWENDSEPAQLLHRKHYKRHANHFHDSGVFMRSDSSSSNEDGFGVDHLPVKGHRRQDTKTAIAGPIEQTGYVVGEEKAAQIVLDCLDNNAEVVDLSNIGLSALSNDTIRPLRDLIALPKSERLTGIEGSYQPFAPKLHLILATNLLTSVPSEIVNLHNLTVLSIRNNQITTLPHSMGKLVNLVELNVAGNRLKWLPAEILDLLSHGKLASLRSHPNPFIKAILTGPSSGGSVSLARIPASARVNIDALTSSLDSVRDDPVLRLKYEWILKIQQQIASKINKAPGGVTQTRTRTAAGAVANLQLLPRWEKPIYLASTAVAFYDFDGTVPRTSPQAPSQLADDAVILPVAPTNIVTYPVDCNLPATGRVQSLFELAARACGQYLHLSKAEEIFKGQGPDIITNTLIAVREVINEGGRCCSVCKKCFVVPRAEWLEYWHCMGDSQNYDFDEMYLPFLRRACSWDCARERATK